MLKKIQYKRIFVTIRRYIKITFAKIKMIVKIKDEEDFDKEYLDRQIRDTVEEIMMLPVTKRFEYISGVHNQVMQKTIKERQELQDKLNVLNEVIYKHEHINYI